MTTRAPAANLPEDLDLDRQPRLPDPVGWQETPWPPIARPVRISAAKCRTPTTRAPPSQIGSLGHDIGVLGVDDEGDEAARAGGVVRSGLGSGAADEIGVLLPKGDESVEPGFGRRVIGREAPASMTRTRVEAAATSSRASRKA